MKPIQTITYTPAMNPAHSLKYIAKLKQQKYDYLTASIMKTLQKRQVVYLVQYIFSNNTTKKYKTAATDRHQNGIYLTKAGAFRAARWLKSNAVWMQTGCQVIEIKKENKQIKNKTILKTIK